MSKEPKLGVLDVLGGKENFEAIALPSGSVYLGGYFLNAELGTG